MLRLACSDEPTWPAVRTVLRAPLFTHRTTSRMRCHFGEELGPSGSDGQGPVVSVKMVIGRAGANMRFRPRRERQKGRHPAQHGVRDLPQRGLRRARARPLRRGGVEPVLQHVEVETAQVFRAEHLQRWHHRVELVDLVSVSSMSPWNSAARASASGRSQQLSSGTASLRGTKSLTLASRKRSVLRMRR